MRTSQRLTGLKNWVYHTLCEGREMKAPAPNFDITKIVTQEPRCYLGWAPARLDTTGYVREESGSVCPGILIMPSQSYAKYVEEKRFDRYNNVHRPQEMGQQLSVAMLFSVYEPGIRLPGFVESADEQGRNMDMSLIMEGTEQGLFTLMNWMDDCLQGLLSLRIVPNTDMFLSESSVNYSLYTDQAYVVDRRPIFYGFINATFFCYAEEGVNPDFEQYLE